MLLKIRAFGRSDIGQVRSRNEDTLAVEPSLGILVVADGMGGAPAGDLASGLAVQEVARGLHSGGGMRESVQAANRKIREMAQDQPALEGMGSTMTAFRLSTEESTFVIGHVGDSRAYLLRNGVLTQLTKDHTVVQDMVDAGRLPRSAERGHPLGHILSRVLGSEDEVDVDLIEGSVEEGDCFLLCTDGLSKVMEEDELEAWMALTGSHPLDEVVSRIVEEANRRGAPDNLTLAVLTVESPPSS